MSHTSFRKVTKFGTLIDRTLLYAYINAQLSELWTRWYPGLGGRQNTERGKNGTFFLGRHLVERNEIWQQRGGGVPGISA